MRKDVWGKGTALSGAMAMCVALTTSPQSGQTNDVGYVERFGEGNFYVGLNYSPAFSRITGFEIRESTGETAAVYPYLKDGKRVEWKANNFDWNTPDPRIRFRDNPIVALEGSVGYSIGSARVELEIGYEQFKTKGIRDTGSKEEEADTVYLLAKKLPHTLVSGENEKFKEELAKTEAKDIVKFAEVVGTSAPEIVEKVCKGKSSESQGHAAGNKKYVCGKEGAGNTHNGPGLVEFGKALHGAPKHWPKTSESAAGYEDNAGQVAKDISALPPTAKSKVAGLLSKTVSGAEVVEIRAVSTTSVMLNACYDLQSEGFSAWTKL